MTESTLRGLARAYAEGRIAKDDYRKQRAEYLDALISGAVGLNGNQRPAASLSQKNEVVNTPEPVLHIDEAPAAEIAVYDTGNHSQTASAIPSSRVKWLTGGGIVLFVIIGIALVLSGGEPEQTATPAAETSSSAANESAPTAARLLIRSFLDRKSWSQPVLETFLQEWDTLSAQDKLSIETSIEFIQLTNAIHKKLLEERALSSIGNPETAYERQRQLVMFAGEIGIDDPRISLPEKPDLTGL